MHIAAMLDETGLTHLAQIGSKQVLYHMLRVMEPVGPIWTLCYESSRGRLCDQIEPVTCIECIVSWKPNFRWHPQL